MNISWRQQIRILKQHVVEKKASQNTLEQWVVELDDKASLLEKENLELRKRLEAYENAHAPPSKVLKKRKKPKGEDGAGP